MSVELLELVIINLYFVPYLYPTALSLAQFTFHSQFVIKLSWECFEAWQRKGWTSLFVHQLDNRAVHWDGQIEANIMSVFLTYTVLHPFSARLSTTLKRVLEITGQWWNAHNTICICFDCQVRLWDHKILYHLSLLHTHAHKMRDHK